LENKAEKPSVDSSPSSSFSVDKSGTADIVNENEALNDSSILDTSLNNGENIDLSSFPQQKRRKMLGRRNQYSQLDRGIGSYIYSSNLLQKPKKRNSFYGDLNKTFSHVEKEDEKEEEEEEGRRERVKQTCLCFFFLESFM
jgi:hypothetical protein